MPANDTRNPDEIERDIRATQRDMSDTVNRIEEQMTPRNLLNGLLDKADESGVDARMLLDGARRNPLALGMIAIGALWLVSDADARPSAISPKLGGGSRGKTGYEPEEDDFHRNYVEHMSRIEHRPDEDFDTYRRRRDHARASYLMIEQRHDEDESSFRKRLDEATERLRERRERMAESTRNFARGTSQRAGNFAHGTYDGASNLAHGAYSGAGQAASQARSFYYDNPLIGGLAAAFVGAVAGAAIPATRTEEEQMGRFGSQAMDRAGEAARHAADQAREKKDELVDKAESQVREGGQSDQSSGQSSGESQSETPRRPEFGAV